MADDREPVLLGKPADAKPAVDDAEPADAEPADAEPADADAEPAPAPEAASAESEPEPTPAAPVKPASAPPAQKVRKRSQAPTFYVAGFWRRLAAAGVDLAIILPVSYAICWIAGSLAGIGLPESRHHGLDFWLDLFLAADPALLGGLGLTLAIGAIYVMVFQVTTSATPGMRLLKTRIIDIYGDQPSTARALARTAGYLAGIATLALGFLWIGFDPEKRGLHDWLSGTYVVKA